MSEPLRVARLFDLSLVWQGFRGFREKCAESHRRPLRRGLRAVGAKFSTKLSTGVQGRQQLFSRIQNLAPKLKFYFKFGRATHRRAIPDADRGAGTLLAVARIHAGR